MMTHLRSHGNNHQQILELRQGHPRLRQVSVLPLFGKCGRFVRGMTHLEIRAECGMAVAWPVERSQHQTPRRGAGES